MLTTCTKGEDELGKEEGENYESDVYIVCFYL